MAAAEINARIKREEEAANSRVNQYNEQEHKKLKLELNQFGKNLEKSCNDEIESLAKRTQESDKNWRNNENKKHQQELQAYVQQLNHEIKVEHDRKEANFNKFKDDKRKEFESQQKEKIKNANIQIQKKADDTNKMIQQKVQQIESRHKQFIQTQKNQSNFPDGIDFNEEKIREYVALSDQLERIELQIELYNLLEKEKNLAK